MTEHKNALPDGAELVSTAGFNQFVGPLYALRDGEDGAVKRYAFVAADKHMNSANAVHGGMLMTFMDVAMSRTARAVSGAQVCSTVSLTTDFVGPGRLGDLIEAHIRVTRRARTMVFMSGLLVCADRTLLSATGLWKIPSEPK